MNYQEFTSEELLEIHEADEYWSQNGWGQSVLVSKRDARSEKTREIRARKEFKRIGDKAREFGCDFTISYSMNYPGIHKMSCDKETTPGGFDKFVEWYRKNILPAAIILEVIK